ncbi:unnamed protein product [Acanthoscelides obtectus]|uniref:Uncharacterized protein n=1 Tax=Acanthoscelides obtectus TaxID=200917 RepID=A0A9P0M9N5_ACAOB|nr:unnamed protein product [Acanthoscelides obtectus]CAK1676942.1 Odorant receptor 30a [Acanthoscelides obtectus]
MVPTYAIFRGKDRYLPYNWWSPCELNVSLYFYGSIIYQLVVVMISGMNNSGIDIVCYKISKIICCQMDLLIGRSTQLNFLGQNNVEPLLNDLIKHHYEIIRLVEILNDLFSPIALVQCGTSGLAICFVGFQLMVTSIEISISYYLTDWYNACSSNVRNHLFLIMERTKRPLELRAGGVFPLTLSTLMSILRSSYSYMAVLQRLNKK